MKTEQNHNQLLKIVRSLLTLNFMPRFWQMPVFIMLGLAVGTGFFVVHISRAPSYLSDDARTCINCHIMVPQFATWQRSSHARVAACNDCHVPHDSVLKKYAFKMRDGLRHAAMFTFRLEPQVIRASAEAKHVIQGNCIQCHQQLLSFVSPSQLSERQCISCHREVPHGNVHSLSSAPNVRYPHLPPVTTSPFVGELSR